MIKISKAHIILSHCSTVVKRQHGPRDFYLFKPQLGMRDAPYGIDLAFGGEYFNSGKKRNLVSPNDD
jgi:hypothetical protein